MFKQFGLNTTESDKRIIVLGAGLEWAGGPAAPRQPEFGGPLRMEDLLCRGALEQEEKFEGKDAHETAYLCYSSGMIVILRSLTLEYDYLLKVQLGNLKV